jgi:kinase
MKYRPHYNLNLESIAVNGQKLTIDSSLFATSNTQGTIVDSGTTLAYLADGAYEPFISAVSFIVFFNRTMMNLYYQILKFYRAITNCHYFYLQITAAVSPSVRSIVSKGSQCFITSNRFVLSWKEIHS